ncbi:Retrovirus-related Pol polyprotein from transposon TNT 1-94, partial [Bienertia sinuspersici]
KEVSDRLWKRFDVVVKQWIYGTISIALCQTILSKGSIAQQTWDKLKSIFQNNKHIRAVYLDNQFTSLHLSNFPNVSAYYQQIKNIADQLANIYQPVRDQKMVLRLCAGLRNTDYDTMATMIQQTDPLLDFYTARSKLLIEESRRAEDPMHSPQSFLAPTETVVASSPSTQLPLQQNSRPATQTGGHGNGRGVVAVEVVVDAIIGVDIGAGAIIITTIIVKIMLLPIIINGSPNLGPLLTCPHLLGPFHNHGVNIRLHNNGLLPLLLTQLHLHLLLILFGLNKVF